jgi:hypothetical protein
LDVIPYDIPRALSTYINPDDGGSTYL